MSLNPEDFPDIESFSIEIAEYETEKRKIDRGSRIITKFEHVGEIPPMYSYRDVNVKGNSYNLAFRFKGMYEDRDTSLKISNHYSDNNANPPKYRHITRILTYTIKYKEEGKKEEIPVETPIPH